MSTAARRIAPEDYAAAGTEHAHQTALFIWASEAVHDWPDLRFMFAIPNGGLRNPATASRMKAEGVKRGVPDVLLPTRRSRYCGLFIEMKKPQKGRIAEQQIEYHDYLLAQGYDVQVCHSWLSAQAAILNYLTGK